MASHDGLVGVHAEEATAAAAVPDHRPVAATCGRDDLLAVGPSPAPPAAPTAAAEEEEDPDRDRGRESRCPGPPRQRGRPVLELPDERLQRGEQEAEQLAEFLEDDVPRDRVAGAGAEAEDFPHRVGRDGELPWRRSSRHGLLRSWSSEGEEEVELR